MKDKYYFIESKSDDYGATVYYIVYCNENKLRKVYFHKEVPEHEIDILKKYINIEIDKEDIKDIIKNCEV